MQAVIQFNKETNKFEGVVNGRVIRRGTKSYVKHELAKNGYTDISETSFQTSSGQVSINVPVRSEFSVDERFHFIEKFVRGVAKKIFPSLILTGSGGTGKSFTVVNTLKKLGKMEMEYGGYDDGDFIVIKGFSTPKALYRTLYENNGKIIVMDDCDSVHKDPIAANIMKAALDSGEKRIISWGAEIRGEDDLPSRFDFYGSVIFISNLTLAKFPQALLSRSVKVDLTLNMEETVERIEHVMKEVNIGSKEEKADTLTFVKEHAAKFTDLNIRSALTILKLRMMEDSIEDFTRVALYTATA